MSSKKKKELGPPKKTEQRGDTSGKRLEKKIQRQKRRKDAQALSFRAGGGVRT